MRQTGTLRALVVTALLLAGGSAVSGCAVLVGGAVGGAAGYVAGHEAAKDNAD